MLHLINTHDILISRERKIWKKGEVEMIDVSTLITELDEKVKQMEVEYEIVKQMQSHVDKKLSIHYHTIETAKFNVVQGYYLAKELQIILSKRNQIIEKHTKTTQMYYALQKTKRICDNYAIWGEE